MMSDQPESMPPSAPLAYTAKGLAALINDGGDQTLSERTICEWCANNQIPGATRIGGYWLIPGSAVSALFLNVSAPSEPQPEAAAVELSSRDLAIVRGLAAGKSQRQIGLELHLAHATIMQYVKRIRAQLGAHHQAHLIAIAKDQRLI
ncbi:MAG: helix-turn-helix transcriptional regulator [Chloroflexi bacterium]|nr:helix-turn-helix transcriptional regulator [Chloroflexota bacterium]